MVHKPRMLYVTHIKATFIDKDTAFLKERFDLIHLSFFFKSGLEIPFLFLKQLYITLLNLRSTRVIFCQFAGYHSFLPVLLARIFGKKSVIMIGGTDAFRFPSIRYGNFRKPILAWFTKKSVQWADVLVPVHESLIEAPWTYYNLDGDKQGLCVFAAPLHTTIYTIYNGYESDWFYKDPLISKIPGTFITIGKALEQPHMLARKGIDLILEVASLFPTCTFYIIGINDLTEMPQAPPNVHYYAQMPQQDLRKHLSQASYYLQLSIAEGFPNALCEAMLCECVPIGSTVAAIPEIIGDTGFLLSNKNVNQLQNLINDALKVDVAVLGKKARERIATRFTLQQRINAFNQLFDTL